MKKALSLVLALLMLMSLCITPVMAAEPEGSESNPYYVANPMAAPRFITIPANSAVYYQYKAAVFNGWEVGGYGLTSIIVDGVVYDTPDMWGEIYAPLNFNMMSPGIVAYVNDTAEDVQVMISHNEPLGTENNPDELENGENAFSIPANNPSYVVDYVPNANGEYTFSTEQSEDFIISIDIDGTAYTLDGSLTLELESYIPVRFYISPIGITGDITLTVTPPKAGTEANPIWMEVDTFYTLEGTDPLYFQVDGFLSGNELLVESFNGTDLTITLDGVDYIAEGGALYLPLETENWVMDLVISQASSAKNTVYFSIQYAEGTEQNPIEIELGDNEISIPEGVEGYYYAYTVEKDGLLVATPAAVDGISYLSMANADYSSYAYLAEGASSMMMPVSAGEVITFEIYSAMDEETFENLALDTVLNIAVKDLVLYTNFEDSDLGGWSSKSALSIDEDHVISGWSSAKFEVTADWGNIWTNVKLEANTDYVISFKAMAAVNKNLWVKFHKADWTGDIVEATVSLTNEWADYSVTLNSGNHTSAVLLLQHAGYAADGQTIWFDDIVVTKVEKDDPVEPPVVDDSVYFDGFENGIGNWATNDGATIESVPSADVPVANPNGGDYALKHTIPSDAYPFISDRTPVAVEPNTDYTITIDVLNTSSNWPMLVMVGTDYWFGGSVFVSSSFIPSTTAWGTYSFIFNSGDNTELYFGMKSQWADTVVYFDNYTVTAGVSFEPEEPVEGNLIVNGNFETGDANGWETWQSTTITSGAAHMGGYGAHLLGNGGWGGMLNQTIAVEAGKTYKLSFWMNVNNNGVNVQVKDGSGAAISDAGGWFDAKNVNKLVEWTFVATDDKVLINFCGAGNGIVEDVYVDSFSLVQLKDPSFDCYITNGDFETGDNTGWEIWQSTAISADAAHSGSYGAHLQGDGGWGGMLNQTVTVIPGKTYKLSFWINVVATGCNVQVKDGSGTAISDAGGWFDANNVDKLVEWTFVATDDSVLINFCGGGNGNAESVYVDDFSLVEVGGETPDVPGDDVVWSADFNDGDKKFDAGEVVAEGPDGSNCLKWTASGGWSATYVVLKNMDPGKDYSITMKVKASIDGTMGVTIQNGDWGSYWNAPTFAVTTEWKDVVYTIPANSIPFNAGSILFKFQDVGEAMDLYVDDIVIIEGLIEVPGDDDDFDSGLVENGGFETGDESGWEIWQSTEITADAAHSGSYGAHLQGNGTWGGMLNQTVTVIPGKTYKLSFWINVVATGCNVQVKDGSGVAFEGVGGWFDAKSVDKLVEWTFVATDDSVFINFCGGGNGNAESVYVDDFSLVQLKDPSFDGYITNGDFETGELTNWINLWNSCTVEFVEGYESDYAMSVVMPGQWQQVRQDKIAVEANTTYRLSAYVKNAQNVSFVVKTGDDEYDITASEAGAFPAGDEWQLFTMEFNTGITVSAKGEEIPYAIDSICILVISYGENGGSVIIDNITLEKVEPEYLPGDANGDGRVNNKDLGLIQQYLADFDVTISNMNAFDVNGDGRVNNKDLGLIQQYLADFDVELKYGAIAE